MQHMIIKCELIKAMNELKSDMICCYVIVMELL
jgi:hypothetical protein